MILPLQAILIADFGLSVIASVKKKRPSFYISIALCLLASYCTTYIYYESVVAVFTGDESLVLFFLIFIFSFSVVVVNTVDSICRANGVVVPISLAAIFICVLAQVLVFMMAFWNFKYFYFLIFVVAYLFSAFHLRSFLNSKVYGISLELVPKFLFFLNGVLLVYFGTRYDLAYLSGEELVFLDFSEKFYAALMFPINVALNVFHSRGVDLRTSFFYFSIIFVALLLAYLYLLGFWQVALFAGIYMAKLFFAIYSYYGNYTDSTNFVVVLASLAYLLVFICTKVFLVEYKYYLEVSLVMIVGMLAIFSISNYLNKSFKGVN